jgi:hypothetical protein
MENPARNDVHATQPRVKKQRPKTKNSRIIFLTAMIKIAAASRQQNQKEG